MRGLAGGKTGGAAARKKPKPESVAEPCTLGEEAPQDDPPPEDYDYDYDYNQEGYEGYEGGEEEVQEYPDVPVNPAPIDHSTKPCVHLTFGTHCPYGENCKFSHDEAILWEAFENPPNQLFVDKKREC